MRAVIQRVLEASVTVEGSVVGEIERGLCVLVGIGHDDGPKELEWLADKLLNLRLFPADVVPEPVEGQPRSSRPGAWQQSVKDINGSILCVSQFTLYANCSKGKRPDMHGALPGDVAKPLFDQLLKLLGEKYLPERIQQGKFGHVMRVALVNDGPVTITLTSPNESKVKNNKTETGESNEASSENLTL